LNFKFLKAYAKVTYVSFIPTRKEYIEIPFKLSNIIKLKVFAEVLTNKKDTTVFT